MKTLNLLPKIQIAVFIGSLFSLFLGTGAMAYISFGGGTNAACLYKDGVDCYWCLYGATTPDPACMKGYALCQNVTIPTAVGESPVSVTENNKRTTYTCTKSGWTSASVDLPQTSACDRYAYRDPTDYLCYPCPKPDFTTENGDELYVRGDNYKFLLMGCYTSVAANQKYSDITGIFVFADNATCYHSGIL